MTGSRCLRMEECGTCFSCLDIVKLSTHNAHQKILLGRLDWYDHETTRYPHIWISSANVRALSHDHWGNEESAILSVPLKAIVKANFL
jgi:hypothetical protein